MEHRLLILGSMEEFVELVKTAQRQNIYTIVVDGYEAGPAKSLADESYNIDVRNTSAIAELCHQRQVDGIITSFSDLLAECMVSIADLADLPCYAKPDQFRILREKTRMKQMFRELGINTPMTCEVHADTITDDLAQIGYPCVVKPVNGYGSHGIYLLNNARQVSERFSEVASHSSFDYILAESYCQGYEFNMMNWIANGEVVTLSVADRETSTYLPNEIPHVSRIVYPSRLIDAVLEGARDIVKKVADYVGITTGPLCMQFFYTKEEGIQVCEVAGRIFGYEHELLTLACGLTVEELLLKQVYDEDALETILKGHSPFHPRCSAGLYFHGREGVIGTMQAALDGARVPHVVDTLLYYQPGQTISHVAGSKPYVVRYYLEADSYDELDSSTQTLYDSVQVLDKSGSNLLFPNYL